MSDLKRILHWQAVLVGLLALLLITGCNSSDNEGADEGSSGSSVSIENKGSDTLVNVALAWAEAYIAEHPEIRLSVTGGGSGTGIAAMINGTVDIANASRAMKQKEIDQAQANGIDPVEHVVARDAIAVVINPENPVDQLTVQQIAAIYTGQITNWKDVGGNDHPIVLTSRESNSGTYVYFLEEVVREGAGDEEAFFSPDALLLPSSEVISLEVARNPNAIGYDGLGYVTEEQKMVAITPDASQPAVLPSIESVNAGTYAISRPLYMYTAGEPTDVVRAYLDWILGPEGQEIVQSLGFVPLSQ